MSGLYYNYATTFQGGLFGQIESDAIVENLGVIDSYIYCGNSAGAIAGKNEGTIRNCYTNSTVGGDSSVGGIVGSNEGVIESCYSTGKVSGNENVGPIAGKSTGNVSNCYYLADKDDNENDTLYAKSKKAFESGEVAYCMNNNSSEGIWKQTIDEDTSPNFNGKAVYCGYKCGESEKSYSNEPLFEEITVHVYDNDCDADCNTCGYTREPEHDNYYEMSEHDGHIAYCKKCDFTANIDCLDTSDDDDHACDFCGRENVSQHSFTDNDECGDCGIMGGYCGDSNVNDGKDVYWTQVDGVRTISGNGECIKYNWNTGNDDVHTIIFEDGVTGFNISSLNCCGNLTKVVLSATMESIPVAEFANCRRHRCKRRFDN